MKKMIFGVFLTLILVSSYAQGTIESLFDKYAAKAEFTSVTISGDLLKLARVLIDRECASTYLPGDITTIRILVQTRNNRAADNFYDLVKNGPDRRKYREFMSVKESGRTLVMLTRSNGRVFREFLIISGGEDNFLVQIKGNMTFKEAKKLSRRLKDDGGKEIWPYFYG
jgi:hypothetical protein